MSKTKQTRHETVTADKAMQAIEPGHRVFIGSACGEPQHLVQAMVKHGTRAVDTEVIQVMSMGVTPYTDPRHAEVFRANAFFIGNSVRDAVNEARADYTPVFFSQVPDLIRSRRIPLDVALVMVSPPDKRGFVSLGVSVDMTRAAAKAAKTVIAQVNPNMPRTLGDSFLHLSEIDYLVEHEEPLLEWPRTDENDEVTDRIADNIEQLISDGDTLQLGIGRLPDALLSRLDHKKDLGIHTEMFSDGVMHLVEKGVITGRRKATDAEKIVGSFAVGSHELFDFMDNNPMIEMKPSDYTNNLQVIARQKNMVAINAALEIDLTGQVVADSLGQFLYSGIGGHADFMRGSALASGGKPVIALPSTATTSEGVRSRIVSTLQEGAGVMNTRGDAHYVVTEYGVAYLHGKSIRERALALINIAHPDYRADLLHAAKHRRLVYADQILPPRDQQYPRELEGTSTLRDGTEVFIRPIRPDDEMRMKHMFYSFSKETRYLRFHGTIESMPHNPLQVFCNVDYDAEMALVALVGPVGHEEVIGVARYTADVARESAEMAFAVSDDYQRKGLGTELFDKIVKVAQDRGIRQFTAQVLPRNIGMLKIFHRSDFHVDTSSEESGVISVTLTPVEAEDARASSSTSQSS